MIYLSYFDLLLASILVVALGGVSILLKLGTGKLIFVAASRNALQLFLVGHVLRVIFDLRNPLYIALIALVMLTTATLEIRSRQKFKLAAGRIIKVAGASVFISGFSTALFALLVVVKPSPWFDPQYAIPLLGMMLGNTMNGISLALDRLNQDVKTQRDIIEQRLMLGESALHASHEIRSEATRTGMIPMINAMAVAGLVSLPGMMTGQILSGTPPVEAVKYQVMIFFLVSAGTGFGVMIAVHLMAKTHFDRRERLAS